MPDSARNPFSSAGSAWEISAWTHHYKVLFDYFQIIWTSSCKSLNIHCIWWMYTQFQKLLFKLWNAFMVIVVQGWIQNVSHFFQKMYRKPESLVPTLSSAHFFNRAFWLIKDQFPLFSRGRFFASSNFFFLCKYTSIMHYTFGWAQVNRCCTPPPGSAP
jgi:hypothetical protein